MVELGAVEAKTAPCCSPAAQETCCEPEAKAECCESRVPANTAAHYPLAKAGSTHWPRLAFRLASALREKQEAPAKSSLPPSIPCLYRVVSGHIRSEGPSAGTAQTRS